MPKGIVKPPPPPTIVSVSLRLEDYQALIKLADDQYRTPELQAGFMLRQILAAAGTDRAAAILNRARAAKQHENGEVG